MAARRKPPSLGAIHWRLLPYGDTHECNDTWNNSRIPNGRLFSQVACQQTLCHISLLALGGVFYNFTWHINTLRHHKTIDWRCVVSREPVWGYEEARGKFCSEALEQHACHVAAWVSLLPIHEASACAQPGLSPVLLLARMVDQLRSKKRTENPWFQAVIVLWNFAIGTLFYVFCFGLSEKGLLEKQGFRSV